MHETDSGVLGMFAQLFVVLRYLVVFHHICVSNLLIMLWFTVQLWFTLPSFPNLIFQFRHRIQDRNGYIVLAK